MLEYLSHWALIRMRDFVIGHKAIFEQAIIAFAKIIPEPTHENVLEATSHELLDMEERFLSHFNKSGKSELFNAAWKIAIFENEHDPHYRNIVFGWCVEELAEAVLDGRWEPRPSRHPSGTWIESEETYGLYKGRKFKSLIKKV